ncbi:MAG: ribosome biogenesis/translation initiation ATPase RLI [Candidatus Diapherotrites archaeon]|nr:ribosome biogenesis/translation initiation ATPase RLI [Candidatus Diapherotrites archaeon]
MRVAVIDRDKCQPKRCAYECIKYCPGVRMGDETITKDEQGRPVISETLCTGCGICVKKCPFHAISIVNLPEELGKPIHTFGVNAFRVFGLPVPKKGVVGIIGPNGIGKTTVMSIVAGRLVPNLGNPNKKVSWDELIELFRGQEIQTHLEALSKGELRVAFKPQNVDLIQKNFNGTVKGLLEETHERNVDLAPLELDEILDRDISDISGGELQRVAIAATLQKKADLYFFDEPSSYLDARQRLSIAKVIRKLSENRKVILVEHDLAVLDYLSDYVHVMYGKGGVYGIVSSLKSVRVGINEFLEGYLRAENMRFRDHAMKFELKPPAEEWKGKPYATIPKFIKKYEGFVLKVDGGELVEGEVIGIVGPNAIGKSTFMRVLAGVEKPTEGEIKDTYKISYKPQYVSADFDGTVKQLITKTEMNKELFEYFLKKEIIDLYDKNVNELSGGEIQRVAVALALSRDADLYLLDEPSAFLDVEQRIRFAEITKKITEKRRSATMVVDHDIVFQDYVSNRLMVFEGVPGKEGRAHSPESMHSGMNKFLKKMEITYRRDPETGRPRANKPKSQKDIEQKQEGEYYYSF